MSAPGWYLYRGVVQGAELIDSYGPPPPDLAAAMRQISSKIEDLLSTVPPDKRQAVLQMLTIEGGLAIEQAAIDAIAEILLADVDLDFDEEDD